MSLGKDCRATRDALPELLFDPGRATAPVKAHLDDCPGCRSELESMHRTMALLDDWHAPEPSAYFNAKMAVKLREEQARPQSLAGRVRDWFLLSNLQLKPLAGGALALALILGGGTYYETTQSTAPAPQASATVKDLQSIDENAQVFQQMNSLDQQDTADDSGSGSEL